MSLETVLDQLQSKNFGKIHFGAVIIWILIGIVVFREFANMESSESYYHFNCGGAKSEDMNLVRGQCYEKYTKQYNKSAFPVYAFVILNYVLIICAYVFYSQLVTPTVNRLSRSIRNDDPEIQSRDQENVLSTGYKLFMAYCCLLGTIISIEVLFIIAQTQLLYPLKFPTNFHCNLTSGTTQPRNSFDNFQHSTIHVCNNQQADYKNFWMNFVLVENGIVVAGILIEIFCLFSWAYKKRDFMQNSKFQTYLNPSKESKQEEERRELVTNKQKGIKHETNILQEFTQNTKKMIKNDTYQPPQLRSLFLSPPGRGHPPKNLILDQIYTNPVVVPNIVNYDFTEDRWRNLEIHTRSGEKNKTLIGPEDILNYKDKKIFIVGRPGIGKTLYCTKILRDWASDKIFHKTPNDKIHFDVAFFFELKTFKDATNLSLRELLTRSTYSPAKNELDDVVWNYILKNPLRVLLIFDGIDEFTFKLEISKEDNKPSFRNIDDKMPLSVLYVKLATGKLLNGAAVMTTTRPTALPCIESVPYDKIYEILGFSSNQVKEYITRFAEGDKKAGDIVREHITSNINILSLCYIPASCFIICSILLKMVEFYDSKSPSLPVRLTDIYKKGVKIFYLRHNEEHRNESFTRKDFETDDLPLEEKKKLEKLEEMAFKGIEKGQLTFGENKECEMRESALFHRLPDHEPHPFKREEQFCFIHLTIQEFFAARHLANKSEREVRTFVSENIKESKWQLVFQFLAGLMQDKNHLPSEIITDLLPEKTEEKDSKYYSEKRWNVERKVTCWPTKEEQDLAVTLIQCLNENSRMTSKAQRKLQHIKFTCVNFVACHFTAVDCSSLVNVINVSHLDLSYNDIGPLGCIEICKLLKHSESQLSWLNLTHNQLTDEAAEYLAEAINNNNCRLLKLNLTANNISHLGAQHLAKAINKLRALDLTANDISHIGAQHLAEALNDNNNQLLALNLSYNNISHIGVQHLAEAINNNCQLQMLDLTAVNISTGVEHLAKAISNKNCILDLLNLSANNISSSGAEHLAKAISNKNCTLQTLNLKANDISHKGAQYLAEAINSNNCRLHTLNLSENYISDIGVQYLAKAIEDNCNLHTLNLSESKILPDGAQYLAEAINKNNCRLRMLDLSNNPAIMQDALVILSNLDCKCEVILQASAVPIKN